MTPRWTRRRTVGDTRLRPGRGDDTRKGNTHMSKAIVTDPGYIGEIRPRNEAGLAGRSLVIWNACPGCGAERWSLLKLYKERGGEILCPSCIGKRTVNQNNLKWWNKGNHKDGCRCARCADQTGSNNPMWNGGISRQGDYVTVKIYQDNPMFIMADTRGYVMEHRLVVAQKLGRPLRKGETVHHINGIKNDNRIENLELWFTNHSHGVRVKDILADWVKLYDYHCPSCNCEEQND